MFDAHLRAFTTVTNWARIALQKESWFTQKIFDTQLTAVTTVTNWAKTALKSLTTIPTLNTPKKKAKIIADPKNLEFSTDIWILKFSEIWQYSPETSPTKIVVPQKTRNFLETKITDLDVHGNIDTTHQDALCHFVVGWCQTNPEILQLLKIEDIHTISPKQAILLSSALVEARLEYNYPQAIIDKRGYHYTIDETYMPRISSQLQAEIRSNPEAAYKKYVTNIDTDPIDRLLEFDKKWICRNYAQAVKGVFDILRQLQTPATTQLTNTYCKVVTSYDKDPWKNAAERIIVSRHAWNDFYTILPTGKLEGVVIDVTFTDGGGDLSYTKNRFLFNLIDLADKGLISKGEQIAQLEIWMKSLDWNTHKDMQEYRAVREYISDYYAGLWDTFRAKAWRNMGVGIGDLISRYWEHKQNI